MINRLLSAVACVTWLALAGTASAASVRPVALGELIDASAVAFEGTCVGNRTERDAATNLVVTYTTFAVKDVLKGDVAQTHVIKQVGGKMPDGQPSFSIAGVPNFSVGQDYVVFLAGVSSAGFSSPVGLAQGRFSVRRDKTAAAEVSNGRDFRAMTADLPAETLPAAIGAMRASPQSVHHLGLEEFKQLVRARAGRSR